MILSPFLGIVGRADVLASIFVLLGLIASESLGAFSLPIIASWYLPFRNTFNISLIDLFTL